MVVLDMCQILTVGVISKDGPLNILFSDMQCHTEIYYIELYDKILVSNTNIDSVECVANNF